MENDIAHHTKNGEVAPHPPNIHIPITAAQAKRFKRQSTPELLTAGDTTYYSGTVRVQ